MHSFDMPTTERCFFETRMVETSEMYHWEVYKGVKERKKPNR